MTRLAYGAAWIAAQQLVSDWMRDAGFLVRRDAVGNLFGRVEGSRGGRVVMSGSHLDTVRGGGALDGALGIVAAIESLDALVRRRGRPQRIVEVVAISDHEGCRFGLPAFGARAMAGRISPDELRARDQDGVALEDALRQTWLDASAAQTAERLDLDVFIELHIEQGVVLDSEAASVGVAESVAGASLLEVTVCGRAAHPAEARSGRRDALAGAAAMILALEGLALVGSLALEPGDPSVVPARVRFSVDVREDDATRRAALLDEVKRSVARIAHERDLEHTVSVLRDAPPRALDPAVARLLANACERAGTMRRGIVSREPHDAAVLAPIARTGIIVVPSIDGRSHCADEATAAADVVAGARALTYALEEVLY